uniref:Ribosomal protein L4 n=1 Tax=Romanomermis culicivorax TaxID=13658 RepID=A0A915K699_ROMCU
MGQKFGKSLLKAKNLANLKKLLLPDLWKKITKGPILVTLNPANSTLRSKRPGRTKAGSNVSGRFVAIKTLMLPQPITRMKQASVRLATARAHKVLPVPGGPYNKTPLGGSMPKFTKRSG